MIAKKVNATQSAKMGKEEVLREIDFYLREMQSLQERMTEDRKQIDALSLQFDKRMENIDVLLDRMAAQR